MKEGKERPCDEIGAGGRIVYCGDLPAAAGRIFAMASHLCRPSLVLLVQELHAALRGLLCQSTSEREALYRYLGGRSIQVSFDPARGPIRISIPLPRRTRGPVVFPHDVRPRRAQRAPGLYLHRLLAWGAVPVSGQA